MVRVYLNGILFPLVTLILLILGIELRPLFVCLFIKIMCAYKCPRNITHPVVALCVHHFWSLGFGKIHAIH